MTVTFWPFLIVFPAIVMSSNARARICVERGVDTASSSSTALGHRLGVAANEVTLVGMASEPDDRVRTIAPVVVSCPASRRNASKADQLGASRSAPLPRRLLAGGDEIVARVGATLFGSSP